MRLMLEMGYSSPAFSLVLLLRWQQKRSCGSQQDCWGCHRWSLHLHVVALLRVLCLQPQLRHLHLFSDVIQPGMMLCTVICKLTPGTWAPASPGWCVCLLGAKKGVASFTGWHGKEHLQAPELSPALPFQQSPADLALGREIRCKIPGAENSSHKDVSSLPIFSQVEILTLQGKISKTNNYPLDT